MVIKVQVIKIHQDKTIKNVVIDNIMQACDQQCDVQGVTVCVSDQHNDMQDNVNSVQALATWV